VRYGFFARAVDDCTQYLAVCGWRLSKWSGLRLVLSLQRHGRAEGEDENGERDALHGDQLSGKEFVGIGVGKNPHCTAGNTGLTPCGFKKITC
jgi:hypothetical protein